MSAQAPVQYSLPPTEQLLLDGGDDRIALIAGGMSNKYGSNSFPNDDLLAFGSSTASTISTAAFNAVNIVRNRLLQAEKMEASNLTYERELDRVGQELRQLCDLEDHPDVDVIFAASGTDLHLIATQLVAGTEPTSTLVVMMDAGENGSGVPMAIKGRHFSNRSALGVSATAGTSIIAGSEAKIEIAVVPIRLVDGTPREARDIDADVESLVNTAVVRSQKVFLILVDVTKTGIIAPSITCAKALRNRLPNRIEVMVDACQFRIGNATLRAYLLNNFLVALTGSKFLTGPTFSGALFIPPDASRRLSKQPMPRALQAYSSRVDWPRHWNTAEVLNIVANFGLLLRWVAALEELRAFRAIPEADITNFLQEFSLAVQKRIHSDPIFTSLAVPPLDRSALIDMKSWDQLPTIFPFLLRHPLSLGAKPLSREKTEDIYRLLQLDLTGQVGFDLNDTNMKIAALQCQLGQPVLCGERDGFPVSALRLCVSARLIVEATAQKGKHFSAVIERALAALEKTAWLVTQGYPQPLKMIPLHHLDLLPGREKGQVAIVDEQSI